jgi:hypothetical protein
MTISPLHISRLQASFAKHKTPPRIQDFLGRSCRDIHSGMLLRTCRTTNIDYLENFNINII